MYFTVPLGDDVLKPSPRCSLCSAPFTHSFIRIHLTVLTALCNKSRGAVGESGTQRVPCSVPRAFCVCGWRQSAGSLRYTCNTASAARGGSSILTLGWPRTRLPLI